MNTAKIYKPMRILMIPLLIIMTISGCKEIEEDTIPIVTGGNPPVIKFKGAGAPAQLYVMGPFTLEQLKEDKIHGGGKDYYMWQLDPSRDFSVSKLSITYGTVPDGFRQVYPANGKSPGPLIEGKIYAVLAPTAVANSVRANFSIYFMIDNGRAVEVPPNKITDK
ncbi:MAG: hypothetical protein MOB07_30335 [Acidobacteria bacterium]|nr:hypothetical protein [Acidobacteriota bacterium]